VADSTFELVGRQIRLIDNGDGTYSIQAVAEGFATNRPPFPLWWTQAVQILDSHEGVFVHGVPMVEIELDQTGEFGELRNIGPEHP